MKVVVDSNRLFAALIAEGNTRKILLSPKFSFIAPAFFFAEVDRKKDELALRIGHPENVDSLFALLKINILVIPIEHYSSLIPDLEKEVGDSQDIPYLACCVATGADGIWTHDKDFLQQERVRIFTNKDLLDCLRNSC
ncbi:hypothetical protein HYV84_04265 [Candidatus Woesearchaeota archaeon]|nr:hypothetical protein [Candidatus Woesearchaeota archaeon]